jgi:mannose-1-phosphate guanylyltransferase
MQDPEKSAPSLRAPINIELHKTPETEQPQPKKLNMVSKKHLINIYSSNYKPKKFSPVIKNILYEPLSRNQLPPIHSTLTLHQQTDDTLAIVENEAK